MADDTALVSQAPVSIADVQVRTKGAGAVCRYDGVVTASELCKVQSARDEVVKIGPVPKDPMAMRLSAVIPGLTEEAVALYHPLILPIATPLIGDLTIAVGAHLLMPHAPRRKRRKLPGMWARWRKWLGKRKKRKDKAKAPPAKAAKPPPLPSPANVIAMKRRYSA